MENGVLAGYPLVDLHAKLYDGSYHEVDSSEAAFKVAASLALRNAAPKGGAVILEPIMKVDIVAPEDNLGDVMGHVTARRGSIDGMEERGNAQLVHSFVPLSEMFGYARECFDQGRGEERRQKKLSVFFHGRRTKKNDETTFLKLIPENPCYTRLFLVL